MRQEAGLSRAEMANSAGLTEKTIYNLENETSGRASFNEFTMEAIARALNLSVPELIGALPAAPENPPAARSAETDDQVLAFYSDASPIKWTIGKEERPLPAELLIQGVWEHLDEVPIRFRVSSNPFMPPQSIEPYVRTVREQLLQELQSNPHLYDGRVASLRSLEKTEEGWMATICPASYFDALATNFRGLDLQPEGEPCSLRELLHESRRALEPLHESPLVNHLGIVCLIETADRKLIIQERSDAVANRGLTLSASVTGAIDFKDVEHARLLEGNDLLSLSSLARTALTREALNELGVEIEEIRLLGLVREFERGGKPELYFYARTPLAFNGVMEAARTKAAERFEVRGLRGLPFSRENKSAIVGNGRVSREQEMPGDAENFTLVCGALLLTCSNF